MQQLHKHGEKAETAEYYNGRVSVYPLFNLGCHECKVFGALDKQEVNDCRRAQSAENADFPFQILAVVEGEYHSRDKLHERAEEKGNRHRKEYA